VSTTLKEALRLEVKARVAALAEAQRREGSTKAVSLLQQQSAWSQASSVLLYAPLGNELDIWPLLALALAAGKLVALPRFDPQTQQYTACRIRAPGEELSLGRYGIREPSKQCELVALNGLDLVLAPGVAFDLRGRRLGRGKGYYDRLLAKVRGKTCGVAFDEQIVCEVPVQPHDSDVNCILTPTRWIEP